MALAICIGISGVLCLRILKRREAWLLGKALVHEGRRTRLAMGFLVSLACVTAFTIQSAWLRLEMHRAQQAYDEAYRPGADGDPALCEIALRHTQRAYSLRLFPLPSLEKKLAGLYFTLGRPDSAEIYLRKVLSADPDDLHARTRLGRLLFNMNRPGPGAEEYALALFPDDKLRTREDYQLRSTAHAMLARYHVSEGDYGLGVKDLEAAVADDSDNGGALRGNRLRSLPEEFITSKTNLVDVDSNRICHPSAALAAWISSHNFNGSNKDWQATQDCSDPVAMPPQARPKAPAGGRPLKWHDAAGRAGARPASIVFPE